MIYEMQIKVEIERTTPFGTRYKERGFKSVKPSGKFSGPYQFHTAEEAQKILDFCYPDIPSEDKKVVCISSGYHHVDMVVKDMSPEEMEWVS